MRELGSGSWRATAVELLAKPNPGVAPGSVSTGRNADEVLSMVLVTVVLVAGGVLALALATRLAAKVRRS
jgi:hypothetical protein